MATALKNPDEKAYGPNGKKAADVIRRLSGISWFSNLGKKDEAQEVEGLIRSFAQALGVSVDAIRWLTKEELPSLLDEYTLVQNPLWAKLEPIPSNIKEKAEKTGRVDLLSYAVNDVPEMVFHGAYDGVFKQFGEKERRVIEIAVGTAMYVSGLAFAWELIADPDAQEPNPFLTILGVFERGHWPLGLVKGQFCVI